jgi:ABC-type phosphate transport system substrate-binding protein
VPAKFADARKREVITAFLKWMLGPGQAMAETMGYAPLPKAVRDRELKAIGQIQ